MTEPDERLRPRGPEADGLNVTEAAAFLGVSRTTVYALLKAGTIPHHRIGTQPRFSRTALVIWQGGAPLASLLARVVAVAQQALPPRAPTAAPTAPTARLTPKHIGGHRRVPTSAIGRIPRSGAPADDRR